ncbi:hypothetical protein CEXT_547781 [Caerostris extrusa]|uniref:Ribosomal protein L20 n=1 Tax=Caerostris extrusa TaxID=172846 RepID=A0AAV4RMQ8_CAEEX|nr:hypothetical protein CEXT_547781 [Caerostris extrusa]
MECQQIVSGRTRSIKIRYFAAVMRVGKRYGPTKQALTKSSYISLRNNIVSCDAAHLRLSSSAHIWTLNKPFLLNVVSSVNNSLRNLHL